MTRLRLSSPKYALRQDARGWFVVRWTDPKTGKTKNKALGTKDKTEAESRFGAAVSLLQTPTPLAAVRIGPVIDAYLEAKPQEKVALRPIKERLGYLEPVKLNDAVARSYADWRQFQDVSDGAIIRELAMLRAALRWGTRNNLGYKLADIGAFTMPVSRPPPRDRWLTREECRRLVYEGCKDTLHLRLFVRIALAVGARREAILQLTWDRVTWPDGDRMQADQSSTPATWPLRWVTDDDLGIEYERLMEPVIFNFGRDIGKKRRVRHVPSGDNAGLYRDLVAAKALAKTEHVIEWDGKPIADIKTALNRAYRRANIPDASGSHLLRHTCCTLLVMSGLSYVQVGKIVGASADMIEKVYGHHSKEFLESAGGATAF